MRLLRAIAAAGCVLATPMSVAAAAPPSPPTHDDEATASAIQAIEACTATGHVSDWAACTAAATNACLEREGMHQRALNACASYVSLAWEEKLLRVEKEALFSPALKRAQARWRSWTEADCRALTEDLEGGSIYALKLGDCRARHTEQRVVDLMLIGP